MLPIIAFVLVWSMYCHQQRRCIVTESLPNGAGNSVYECESVNSDAGCPAAIRTYLGHVHVKEGTWTHVHAKRSVCTFGW